MSARENTEQVELAGNTLLLYWYLLRKRQGCGVREIQRVLGFSSSSTTHYHLEKLASKGILIKDQYGSYRINEKAKVGRISPFIFVNSFVLPTQFVYAIVTTAMCLLFLAIFRNSLTSTVILALSPGIVASVIFWFDAVKVWRRLPSFKKGVR